jgi:hypothetical protein
MAKELADGASQARKLRVRGGGDPDLASPFIRLCHSL